MKKLFTLGAALLACGLFAAELDINGKFADNGKNWVPSRKHGTVTYKANGEAELKLTNNKVGYMGIYTTKYFSVTAQNKITMTLSAKGKGRLEFGFCGSKIGNQFFRLPLKAEYADYTHTFDLSKLDAKKLPEKIGFVIIVSEKDSFMTVKSVKASLE